MTLGVTARLAQGRASATNTQAYVSACHALGYRHPDLTAHGAQVFEWYGGEDGLDLNALDADCAALRAASAAADEAVRVTRDGLVALTAEWHGESGSVAVEFIEGHSAAGVAVAAALQAAAEVCEALRDGLWRLVDEKAAAAVSIDDRRAGERPVWLAAAGTVTSRGAAQTEADEVVTQQITPYVDTDIRTEWITAMRSTTESVSAAYEDAVRQLDAFPTPHFDVPGPLGGPPPLSPPASPPTAGQTVPAAASPTLSTPVADLVSPAPPPVPDTVVAQPLPPPPPPVPPTEPPAQPGLPAPAPAGMPGAPDIGGGLSGLVSQIADALGGLFDRMPDTPAGDSPEPDDPVKSDEHKLGSQDEQPDTGKVEGPVPEEEPVAGKTAGGEIAAGDEPPETKPEPVESVPPPPDSPAPQPSSPPAEDPAEQTPCEIAADELPQVGQ